MNVLRFLRPECIRLGLATAPTPPPEMADGEEEPAARREARLRRDKEALLGEFATLMDASGEVANATKYLRDLVNRERKATTGIHPGVAIPHVRSMQVRSFFMGLARADGEGFPFLSLDGEPTRLFFILAAPPWDDRTYLAVYRELAQIIQDEDTMAALLAAAAPQDVFNALRAHWR